jgi:Uncharacterized protein conserved in bacteria (DUF2252)
MRHKRPASPRANGETHTGYVSVSATLGRSVTDFSKRYADQNEQDYQQLVQAVRTGRLEAVEGM